jgi:hypothetical protein
VASHPISSDSSEDDEDYQQDSDTEHSDAEESDAEVYSDDEEPASNSRSTVKSGNSRKTAKSGPAAVAKAKAQGVAR